MVDSIKKLPHWNRKEDALTVNTQAPDKSKSKEDKRAAALRDNLKKRKAKAKEGNDSRKKEDK